MREPELLGCVESAGVEVWCKLGTWMAVDGKDLLTVESSGSSSSSGSSLLLLLRLTSEDLVPNNSPPSPSPPPLARSVAWAPVVECDVRCVVVVGFWGETGLAAN